MIELPISALILGLFIYAGLKKVKVEQKVHIRAVESKKFDVDHADKVDGVAMVIEGNSASIMNSTFNAPPINVIQPKKKV